MSKRNIGVRGPGLVAVLLAGGLGALWACGDDELLAVAPDAGGDAAPVPDGSPSSPPPPIEDAGASTATLDLRARRAAGPGDGGPAPVVLEIAPRASGAPAADANLVVEAPDATVSPVVRRPDGVYEATLTPLRTSGELLVQVRWALVGGLTVRAAKTLLVLPEVGDGWEQPEAVDGLVNSPAYEDGIQVSPDGAWLFVSSYSPIDVFACTSGGDPDASTRACNQVLGPYAAPERPGMFGADRIVSPTRIRNRCDRVCLTQADGGDLPESLPLPPVAAFGFRRQPDGTYREPFAVGVEADGCIGPFGYAMAAPPAGTSAEVVFAVRPPGASANAIWSAPLVLGQRNVLATFQCVDGGAVSSGVKAQPLAVAPEALDKGNPAYAGGYLFFDDEYGVSPPRLYVAKSVDGGAPSRSAFEGAAAVAVGSLADDQRQPFFDPPRLTYTKNLSVVTATLSGDPTDAAAWTTPRVDLRAEPGSIRVGAIVAVGEPSIAKLPDGTRELFFVYATKTATGLDFNAGRVRAR